MVVPVGTVLAIPFEVLEVRERIRGREVLKEKLGAREEGHAVSRWAGFDGGEVLEAGDFGDQFFNAGCGVEFLLEEEEAVVVHGHGFGGCDSAGFGVVVAGVLDDLADAEGPGGDGAGVVSFGFEDVLICRFGETAQNDGGACFGEAPNLLHVHVV